MNIIEAFQELKKGKKIFNICWIDEDIKYIELGKNDYLFKDDKGNDYEFSIISEEDLIADIWEIYGRHILNEKEMNYLSDIIKPFKDDYKITIVKTFLFTIDYSYIRILLENENGSDTIALPKFASNSHMYDGMEYGKIYQMEELGL